MPTKTLSPGTATPGFPLPRIHEVVNNRYVIGEQIGAGGFGVVFRARDRMLKKPVALKFLNPQLTGDEKSFLRVRREVNNAQQIVDPRIVKIFSLETYRGKAPTIYFMVMELIDGQSLKSMIRSRGRLSWDFFQPMYMEILEGIAALHRRGIIHRDLKPSNIMITGEGSVKILDFGLSKGQTDLEATSSIGEIIGSPHFMSPEQIEGSEVGMRSDLYQAALILYHALSGNLPFRKDTTTMELLLEKIRQQPIPIKSHDVHISRFLEFGILRGLARRPGDRFPDINSMIEYFRGERSPRLGRFRHFLRRHRLRASLLILLGIAVTFFGIFYVRHKNDIVDFFSRNGRIRARNRFGLTIWEKDFTPFSISRIIRMHERTGTETIKVDSGTRQSVAAVCLTNPKLQAFDPEFSITSDQADNRLVILDARGREVFNKSYTEAFLNGDAYGFSRRFHISSLESTDLDKDGSPENLLRIHHAPAMFPSAFGKISEKKLSFVNPGTITAYWPLKKDPSHNTFLLYGRNNLLSHFEFVAEIELGWDKHAIPNLNNDTRYNIHGFMVLAPEGKVIRNDWESLGTITIQDTRSQDLVTIHRGHHLSIQRAGHTLHFQDDPREVRRVFSLINRAFSQKRAHDRPDLACECIDQALKSNVQSPYLLSCLFYLKGDLEILMGEYRKGRQNLLKALTYYPHNTDARQRICDSHFLAGDLKETFATLSEARMTGNKFWGISLGLEIYRFYCDLHSGDFMRARDFFETRANLDLVPKRVTNGILQSVFQIFRGKYSTALARLESLQGENLEVFTIEEYRLILARALLLKKLHSGNLDSRREKRLAFYFRDIFHNSHFHKTMAAVSHFLVQSKESSGTPDAPGCRKRLARAFSQSIINSRGDFTSRFWLFYDAYIYGRAMEHLGDIGQAARGYRICSESNPYTALARDARTRLERLSSPGHRSR